MNLDARLLGVIRVYLSELGEGARLDHEALDAAIDLRYPAWVRWRCPPRRMKRKTRSVRTRMVELCLSRLSAESGVGPAPAAVALSDAQKRSRPEPEGGVSARQYEGVTERPLASQPGRPTAQTPPPSPSPSSGASAPPRKRPLGGAAALSQENVLHPSETFASLAGIDVILQEIRELIEYPLTHPEIYSHLGVDPPRGILLHGPPGCGKTLLAHAIAGELSVPLIKVSAPEIVSGMSGESEEKIRQLFEQAASLAPSILFLDEVDAIMTKRDSSQKGMERRIVAQLLTSMDNLSYSLPKDKVVIVLGATNRPDALDSALRRAGRFDREISIGIPDLKAREAILLKLTQAMKIQDDFSAREIAVRTPGFVGADLEALVKEAAVFAVNRIFQDLFGFPQLSSESSESSEVGRGRAASGECTLETRGFVSDQLRKAGALSAEQLSQISLRHSDFLQAIGKVQPSAQREGFTTIPDVTWEDIGALEQVRREILLAIVEPIRNPELFESFGLSMPAGILLYGPPGCGKTLLAKAVANESGANFISIKGPELLNKYVGESERAIRQLFERARASSPCVVFFDELDSVCPRRGIQGESGVSERVVNQLLTEMDGLESRKNVFVIAATNRPDIIDPAMLRPGRLDKLLFVPLPNIEGREAILQTLTRRVPLSPDVNLHLVATDLHCERFSGADLNNLVREAALCAITPALLSHSPVPPSVSMVHFREALERVQCSVSERDQKRYQVMKDSLRGARGKVGNISDE